MRCEHTGGSEAVPHCSPRHSSAPSSRTWACHQATAQNTMPNPWSFPCQHLSSKDNGVREMPTSLLLFYRNSSTPAFIQVNPTWSISSS